MDYDEIDYEVEDHILTITLDLVVDLVVVHGPCLVDPPARPDTPPDSRTARP